MDRTALTKLIKDTLQDADVRRPEHILYSEDAVVLILCTIAIESGFGEERQQRGHGPALGIVQMEPATFDWLKAKYPRYLGGHTAPEMIHDDALAILACRLRYQASPGALPDASDIEGQWLYYKRNYNSMLGAATRESFMAAHKRFLEAA